jgi:hypothetical protein
MHCEPLRELKLGLSLVLGSWAEFMSLQVWRRIWWLWVITTLQIVRVCTQRPNSREHYYCLINPKLQQSHPTSGLTCSGYIYILYCNLLSRQLRGYSIFLLEEFLSLSCFFPLPLALSSFGSRPASIFPPCPGRGSG